MTAPPPPSPASPPATADTPVIVSAPPPGHRHARRFTDDFSLSALVAGVIAVLTGFTSSAVLMYQAGAAAHLSDLQIASWMAGLSLAIGVITIFLSLRWRMPIVIAWSTPGAALLISSLPGVPYAEAIGAYLISAALIVAIGLSGWTDALMRRIPAAITAALLAGILFRIAIAVFPVVSREPVTLLLMLASYLLAKRVQPRYAIVVALVVGVIAGAAAGHLDFSAVHPQLVSPVFTLPRFSVAATVSIGLPLFIVAMTSQNMPGLAVLRADHYKVRSSTLLGATGFASLLTAPFGAHGVTVAAISAAICTGPDAHEDPRRRYVAAVVAGVLYLLAALFASTIAALIAALPGALVLAVAALALLGSMGQGLADALRAPGEREAALLTFLITASGITVLSIGSAFWGVLVGVVAQAVLGWRRR
ncbi:benzoate/H(+) symporter BenE family transporter [Chitinasiproducens palmae]|uniref:Benzoate membrane transport protein n=1 Tax=Chitinasiproducens palmae TaxID=1770053 RepID=A0A1H2PUR6_9BURK|nr:benzoate/H(+) symporter BenE family transporter [Chitinasiproducens palmae]SDV50942.1 benzoate membrane transport protein [Chitinasiproducens palmae]